MLREIRRQLPDEALIYLADQARLPYGPRAAQEIRRFAVEITHFLLALGCKVVVVACNTASAAALDHLRAVFPDTPFVGMEPAVKPAASNSRSRVVGVLATQATLNGERFANVVARFAGDARVLPQTCDGLVELVEAGEAGSLRARELLESCLAPLIAQGMDALVLGCTHYPFLIPVMRQIVGPEVELIDPSPAVARQVARVLSRHNLKRAGAATAPGTHFYTTGDPDEMRARLREMISVEADVRAAQLEGRRARLPGRD